MSEPDASSPLSGLTGIRRRIQAARCRARDYLWRLGLPVPVSPQARAFEQFKQARSRMCPGDLACLRMPCKAGLVSIVLPVFNGERYLHEALDSILGQTYRQLEVIAVDDGSCDRSPEILDQYARRDGRVRVIRQPNQGLPRALSNGSRACHGEYLTWVSDDNRLRPEFVAKFVGCLDRHPAWDAVYGNETLIGENGKPLTNYERYPLYQWPLGSGHVRFPSDVSRLNTSGENYVGAAFMYRYRVLQLIGDYSPRRFGLEDYDYWMRINGLMTLRHVDFPDCLYEYRYHGKSLTSRHEELRVEPKRERLMAFEELRRDFCLRPLAWRIESAVDGESARTVQANLARAVKARGHVLLEADETICSAAAEKLPVVYVGLHSAGRSAGVPPESLPDSAMKVLVCAGDPATGDVPTGWDFCVTWLPDCQPRNLVDSQQGWVATADVETLASAVDIRARSHHLARMEAVIESGCV